ncbi:hypothetical protein PFICI_05734 [Pestalotiopsis fici W106-1]|uniref:Uncharacterized protein n=1 Tax=Pestalotiopsis fici (strain W106-1 / CGMCC3.15140) TaxID=1229662 RepID=W3XCN1_PESFW|nr:uncharacterized protein PFICI_05734 [Pestalotiopsis fici W106-1]ETS83858.1 hypothetical protein PFICI_05734 [Pestalotiopsis fici W106-1]
MFPRLLCAIVLAVGVAAEDGDDFANNLLSDLAPLLALFGERVTMQFMSQSLGWADNIILAMVPLGIITIISSAIRVGGPSFLKALIGRARENLAIAEQELMSSTSKEVCELWNGHEVVRCMGSCPVSEFICLLPGPPIVWNGDVTVMKFDEVLEKHFLERGRLFLSFPTFSTSTQVGELNLTLLLEEKTWKDMYKRIRNAISPNSPKGQKEVIKIESKPKKPLASIIITRNPGIDAPNVSLNSHSHTSRAELRMVAVLGIIFQLGVLIFSGCAVYHPTLEVRLQKDGNPVARYAFPCNAIGTVLLVVGMLLCAHVVESSTSEKTFRPSNNLKAQLVWLQQKKTVNDQVFDSFAIYAKTKRASITTSRRWSEDKTTQDQSDKLSVGVLDQQPPSQPPASTATSSPDVTRLPHPQGDVLEMKTILGTTIGLCGFIVQFVGLRGLHWSASIVQLGVVLLMTGLRAWVRRGLAKPPCCQHILSEFELDWFATTFADAKKAPWWPDVQNKENKRWSLDRLEATDTGFGNISEPPQSELPHLHAHRVMKIRRDLAQLASWHGPVSAEAISIARSIEVTMDFFFRDTEELNYTWALNSPTHDLVVLRLHRENGKWQAYADELEAALSLWLFSVDKAENDDELDHLNKSPIGDAQDDKWLRAKGLSAKNSLRILGSYSQSLHRDLWWWIPHETTRIISLTEVGDTTDLAQPLSVRTHRIVGSGRISRHTGKETRYGIKELPEINFNSKSSRNSDEKGENDNTTITTTEDEDSQKRLAVEFNGPLRSLFAQDIFSSFWVSAAKTLTESSFTEPAEIYSNHTTSNEPWRSFSSSISLRNEQFTKLARTIQSTGLGSLDDIYLSMIPPLSAANKLPPVSHVIDLARHHAEPHEYQQRWNEASYVYLWLFSVAKTFPADSEFATQAIAVVVEFLRQVSSALDFCERLALEPELDIYPNQRRWENKGDINTKDVLGWTPLHYAGLPSPSGTVLAPYLRVFPLGMSELEVNSQDLLGWTPLHYACGTKKPAVSFIRELVRSGADINIQGRDGVAPIHCAAMNGNLEVVNLLAESGANIDIQDASGKTPLLWACISRNRGTVEYLLKNANTKLRDGDGRTALHLAATFADDKTVSWLLEHGADALAVDREVMAPLHCAAECGHLEIVQLLCQVGKADVNAKDGYQTTPLHYAVLGGHEPVVRWLVRESEADLNAKNWRDMMPLHYAALCGHEAIVKCLIKEAGADAEARGGEEKGTAIYFAVRGRHESIVQFLIDQKVNIEANSILEEPVLHLAVRRRALGIAKLLLDAGAREYRNYKGQTALDLAGEERDAFTKLFAPYHSTG